MRTIFKRNAKARFLQGPQLELIKLVKVHGGLLILLPIVAFGANAGIQKYIAINSVPTEKPVPPGTVIIIPGATPSVGVTTTPTIEPSPTSDPVAKSEEKSANQLHNTRSDRQLSPSVLQVPLPTPIQSSTNNNPSAILPASCTAIDYQSIHYQIDLAVTTINANRVYYDKTITDATLAFPYSGLNNLKNLIAQQIDDEQQFEIKILTSLYNNVLYQEELKGCYNDSLAPKVGKYIPKNVPPLPTAPPSSNP